MGSSSGRPRYRNGTGEELAPVIDLPWRGTFVVGNSGSTTVTMPSGVDPHDFPAMETAAETPGNGALTGAVLLTGRLSSFANRVSRPSTVRPGRALRFKRGDNYLDPVRGLPRHHGAC
jgi:hypothetical protein